MLLAARDLELEQLVRGFFHCPTIKIATSSEYDRSAEKYTGFSFQREYLWVMASPSVKPQEMYTNEEIRFYATCELCKK